MNERLASAVAGDGGLLAQDRHAAARHAGQCVPGHDVIVIGENDLRALKSRHIPGLGTSGDGDTHVRGDGGCNMVAALGVKHQWSVDFINNHAGIVVARQVADLLQGLLLEHQAQGIVGVDQNDRPCAGLERCLRFA